ncbi:hypothetical protein [Methylocapsa palsarum]|nr:hypothetical protein [Methylocapsa palsarum]
MRALDVLLSCLAIEEAEEELGPSRLALTGPEQQPRHSPAPTNAEYFL